MAYVGSTKEQDGYGVRGQHQRAGRLWRTWSAPKSRTAMAYVGSTKEQDSYGVRVGSTKEQDSYDVAGNDCSYLGAAFRNT